jgi:two-component system OmpR family sensor kinase
MTLIAVASVFELRRYLIDDLDDSVRAQWLTVAGKYYGGGDVTSRYYGGVADSEGTRWDPFRTSMSPDQLPDLKAAWISEPHLDQPFTVSSPSGEHWRIYINRMPSGQLLMIAASQMEVEKAVQRLITINLFGGISVLLFAATIGAELIRRSMRPLSQIEKTASAIAAGDLSQRVPRSVRCRARSTRC